MNQLLAPFVQMRLIDVVDILLVTAIVYTGLVWLRRTQAWLVASGMLILGAFYVVARVLELQLTAWIFQGFFAVFLVMIIVIFQEELRQMFEQVAVWGLRRARRPPVASETTRQSASQRSASPRAAACRVPVPASCWKLDDSGSCTAKCATVSPSMITAPSWPGECVSNTLRSSG
jgi:hypothetical protein